MFKIIIDKIRWRNYRKEWRKKNQHNHCEIQNYVKMENIHIGKETYGMINAHIYRNSDEQLYIGNYCSIAENVHFVFGEHDYRRFSTFPFDAYVFGEKENNPTKGAIVIEDDVWIGMNSTVLSGVTIHQGAVIGAGSVVSKDVPPYAIFAGGRIIKYRFDEDTIRKLLQIDFNKLDYDGIMQNRDILYNVVDDYFFETTFYKRIVK